MSKSIFELQPYYHSTVENLITAFGSIFNGITITKKDDAGKTAKNIRVPIEYGPKHKWLERLKEQPDVTKGKPEITLPRLAFEVVDYQYDASRRVGVPGSYTIGRRGSKSSKIYNPVPYNVTIQLHSICKDQQDSLRILEQILPYFSPEMNISIMVVPEYNIVKKIPIVLNGVNVEDNYEGSVDEFRTVVQTFAFTAKLDLFGPIVESDKVIKHAIVGVDINQDYSAIVNPITANKDGVYVIDETWNGTI